MTVASRPQRRPPGTWQAITSLTVGTLALLFSWVPGINALGALAAMVALVLGVVGAVKASRHGGPAVGMAIGGVVTSVLAIVASVTILWLTWMAVSSAQRYWNGDLGYESSTDADGRATGPIADDVDIISCGPSTGDDSLEVGVSVDTSWSFTSDYVVLVHALDVEGRQVGESMQSIRSVDPGEEKVELFSITVDGSVAECVVVKVVRL